MRRLRWVLSRRVFIGQGPGSKNSKGKKGARGEFRLDSGGPTSGEGGGGGMKQKEQQKVRPLIVLNGWLTLPDWLEVAGVQEISTVGSCLQESLSLGYLFFDSFQSSRRGETMQTNNHYALSILHVKVACRPHAQVSE